MAWNEPSQPRGMDAGSRPGAGSNFLKTGMLMAFLIAVLAIGGQLWRGPGGMLLFGSIGLVFNFLAYWFSDKVALAAHRAQPVSREQLPELHEMVERLCRRAGLPVPRLYLIPSATPNAFATGRSPAHAAVAVTEGILRVLTPRQLEGVLAHELAHVKNRDILIATVAAAVAGLIASLGHAIQWGALLGGLDRGRDGERGGGLGALAWALLAPLIAMVIQLAVSRSREYGADATGAGFVGDPEPLAEALLTLEAANQQRPYPFGGPATAHLFIVAPLTGGMQRAMELFSTHPPIEERVRRLRELKRGMRWA